VSGDVIVVGAKLQIVLPGQVRDELLVRIGFLPSQLVVAMDEGEDNTELRAQFEQQPQERDRIDSPRDRNSDAISGPEEVLPTDLP
jgi:hypothetical protein